MSQLLAELGYSDANYSFNGPISWAIGVFAKNLIIFLVTFKRLVRRKWAR